MASILILLNRKKNNVVAVTAFENLVAPPHSLTDAAPQPQQELDVGHIRKKHRFIGNLCSEEEINKDAKFLDTMAGLLEQETSELFLPHSEISKCL